MLSDNRPQMLCWHYTRLSPFQLAVLEQHERWDALDLVASGELRVPVDIDLDDLNLVAHFSFQLFQDRLQHFAGTTPLGREIDEHGCFTFDDLGERSVCHGFLLRCLVKITIFLSSEFLCSGVYVFKCSGTVQEKSLQRSCLLLLTPGSLLPVHLQKQQIDLLYGRMTV